MTLDQFLDITIVIVTILIVLCILGMLLWNPLLEWGIRRAGRLIEARESGTPGEYIPGARCPVYLGNLAGEQCRLAAGHPDSHNFTWEQPAAWDASDIPSTRFMEEE
jgi:hypothetical protein